MMDGNAREDVYRVLLSEFAREQESETAKPDSAMVHDALIRCYPRLLASHGEMVARNVMTTVESLAGRNKWSDIRTYLERKSTVAKSKFDWHTIQREKEDDFDRINGTETSEPLEQLELPEEVSVERWLECARYHPSPVSSVRLILDSLQSRGLEYEEYCFIDIGAGLGRNLLLANGYSFKRIIGVEISQYLCDRALSNIAKFGSEHELQAPIEVVCSDARQYELPDENLLLYFWEPFAGKPADEFVASLERHVQSCGKKVCAIFLGSAFEKIKASTKFGLCDMFETRDNTTDDDKYFVVSIFETVP